MKTKTFFWAFVALGSLYLTNHATAQNGPTTTAQTSQVADVAIMNFTNSTKSANYDYLSVSLSDAIHESMKDKFEYKRTDPQLAESKAKFLFSKGFMPGNTSVKKLATEVKSDYVVYGTYTLNAKKTEVTFTTRIYIAPDKFLDVPPVTNKVDGTIFAAVGKVAEEIVRKVREDAIAQAEKNKIKMAADAAAKVTLTKAQPAPVVVKEEPIKPKVETYRRQPIGAGVTYGTNYFDRHTQYYVFPAAMTMIEADYTGDSFRIFGEYAIPGKPQGTSVPATYESASFWKLGLEMGSFDSGYFGLSYTSQGDPNPAGYYVRDFLTSNFSFYGRYHIHLFNALGARVGLNLASYFDLMNAKLPNAKDTDLHLLWNTEGGISIQPNFDLAGFYFNFNADTSVALFDTTSQFIDTTSGGTSWTTNDRLGKVSGLRLSLSLNRRIMNIFLRGEVISYQMIDESFRPYDTTGTKKSSLTFFQISAYYRFGNF